MVGERVNSQKSNESFFLCLKPECNSDDMSEEEIERFNKGVREMINYAHEVLNDDSFWKS